jgi:uncharacterized protein GlcG (DUF336 family)
LVIKVTVAPTCSILVTAHRNLWLLCKRYAFKLLAGGVPILVDHELIGAIGVAGSPASRHDAECADTAISRRG